MFIDEARFFQKVLFSKKIEVSRAKEVDLTKQDKITIFS